MCLIVFAWQVVPGMPLLAAGNRDEFYERPAAPAGWWSDHPHVYAGRDLQGGGTWMGVTRNGRFAAITNVRAPDEKRSDAPTRGRLVADYLSGDASPEQYIEQVAELAHRYNGFNLLVGHAEKMIWFSNAGKEDPRNGKPLGPGIYGLSNGLLDSPWPKVVRTKAQFGSLLCQGAPEDAYFEMLADTARAPDCRLPRTGVSLEWERVLSAVCIDSPEYGTRVSTVVRLNADNTAILREQPIR
ncbi:NRDE family protein [Noviherbaspirillum autotrophicum]|uniref:Signal peptide protein n=1 Tax=Noviherbaspirillum autotrophicum TaxID=709839 RepID=A0A0C2BMR4_9BURK|nr:NRDE family protein [Noviherbaspirillum autotrophicum]KIF82540.1 signal peptide protein [Noviherbaspirillum autotrophicum]